jgi:hypothetical protein
MKNSMLVNFVTSATLVGGSLSNKGLDVSDIVASILSQSTSHPKSNYPFRGSIFFCGIEERRPPP